MQAERGEQQRRSERPANDGLPSAALVRVVLAVSLVGIVAAVALLLWRPVLPNERSRTAAAPQRTVGGRAAPAAIPAQAPARGAITGAAPAASVAPRGTATTTPAFARRHTVQAGDTLRSLAERYDSTIDALRAANPGIDPDSLPLGKELTIPPSR